MAGEAGKLWVDGGFSVRVFGPSDGRGRDLSFDRPYALVGRFADAGVRIDDPLVSNRHVYLHLDRRGLFAVDLASRTGTRIGADGLASGWLAEGDALEVAGHRIELIAVRVDTPGEGGAPESDPLADSGPASLARVTLYPNRPPGSPLVLGSELIFMGRSPNCGVQIDGAAASRIHCVLVRARDSAYLVDLVGRGLWVNDEPIPGAGRVRDGDSLMIGPARFDVRIEPPGAWRGFPGTPAPRTPGRPLGPDDSSTEILAYSHGSEVALPPGAPPLPPGLLPAETQAALMGWMMGVLKANQDEMLRRQEEFRSDMTGLLAQIHRDHKATLRHHLERVEAVHRDLSSLREEIGRRFGPAAPTHRAEPPATPRRPELASPARPEPIPIPIPIPTSPAAPAAAANWLLTRVNQLEAENRSTWRDLLARLTGSGPQSPA